MLRNVLNAATLDTLHSWQRVWMPAAGLLSEQHRQVHVSSTPAAIRDITSLKDFQTVMADSTKHAIILKFYAIWCKTSQEMLPRLEKEVDATDGKVKLARINIDKPEFAPLLAQVQVQSVPTLVAIYGAKMLDAKMGTLPSAEMKAWVEKVASAVPPDDEAAGDSAEAKPEPVKSARELVMEGYPMVHDSRSDLPTVVSMLVKALEAPDLNDNLKAKALAGLAHCSLRQVPPDVSAAEDLSQSATAAADIPESRRAAAIVELAKTVVSDTSSLQELETLVATSPRDLPLLERVAKKQFVTGKYQEAVDTALKMFKIDKQWEDETAKKTLLLFFDALTPEDPITAKGRRKLSNLMFV